MDLKYRLLQARALLVVVFLALMFPQLHSL
jgi:hypothetical protein